MVSLLVTPVKAQDPFEVWTFWALGIEGVHGVDLSDRGIRLPVFLHQP